MVLFSPNVLRAQRTNFGELLGMTVVENLNNYLSLPIPIGKKKIATFKEINNRLSCRINSWTKRQLSFGGKEVFIKAVLQSIPTYALSIFLAPKGVIDDFQAKLSRIWWSRKDKDRRSWNVNKVNKVYGKEWGDKIYKIPIGDVGQGDKIIWFHNRYRCFTSKSAYSWLVLKEIGYGPHRIFWKASWKLDTLAKIRVFTWCMGHEILSTNVKITSIRQGFDKGCPRCGVEAETLLHALKDCPTSRAILSLGGWSMSFILKKYDHCIDLLEDMMRAFDKRAMLCTVLGLLLSSWLYPGIISCFLCRRGHLEWSSVDHYSNQLHGSSLVTSATSAFTLSGSKVCSFVVSFGIALSCFAGFYLLQCWVCLPRVILSTKASLIGPLFSRTSLLSWGMIPLCWHNNITNDGKTKISICLAA
ncbi:hypothetical protein PVK06_030411 [Gossypium arboreum]|uniref:Reverse transcriptase zinc-binding domain-containing protein n=1 Tax=Gossypium arboreum TaxID=29729 RepID=A0ABR0NNR6_GOSAR|nr:hypothetical protein PVK06_030411 [Gossypium arboreum]